MTEQERFEALRHYVCQQPVTRRQIILLHYADGLAPAEIAYVLDLPEDQVGRSLQQAKAVGRIVVADC